MSTTIRSDTVRQASAGRAGGTAGPHNSKSIATVAFTDHAAPHARLYQPDGQPLPGPESYPGDTGNDWTGLAFSPDGLYLAACLQAPPAGFYTNVAWWKKTGSWEPMPPPAADVVQWKLANDLSAPDTYRWGTQPRKTIQSRLFGFDPIHIVHTDGTTADIPANAEVAIVDQILPALSQLLWSPDGVHLAGIRTVARTGSTQTYKLAVFRRVGDTLTWLPEDISLRDRQVTNVVKELPGLEPAFDLTWADPDTIVITHNGLATQLAEL